MVCGNNTKHINKVSKNCKGITCCGACLIFFCSKVPKVMQARAMKENTHAHTVRIYEKKLFTVTGFLVVRMWRSYLV